MAKPTKKDEAKKPESEPKKEPEKTEPVEEPKANEKLTTVIFLKSSTPYVAGDVAALPKSKAKRLIELEVAEEHKK